MFRVIPVLSLLMLAMFGFGPYEKEFTWEIVVAGSFMLIILISLTTFDYSNKPNEDEADAVNKKKTNKGQ